MKIRQEKKEDFFPVEQLTREAFYNVYRPGCTEHFVLHRLRKDRCFVKKLSYVIEEKGRDRRLCRLRYRNAGAGLGGNLPDPSFRPYQRPSLVSKSGLWQRPPFAITLQKAKQMGVSGGGHHRKSPLDYRPVWVCIRFQIRYFFTMAPAEKKSLPFLW